jgi:uncharacterized membrane protein
MALEVFVLRLPHETIKRLREKARRDDRPLAAFARRALVAVAERDDEPRSPDR